MTTLIASLGLTPAVITETLDYLMPGYRNHAERNRNEIDRLVVVYPGKQKFITESLHILIEEWCDTFKKEEADFHYSAALGYLLEYEDILTKEAVIAFGHTISALTRRFQKDSEKLFYNMAGGRKSMAAVMAYLAPLHRVNGIFHVTVEDRFTPFREGEAFFEHIADFKKRKLLLYPDPDKVKFLEMSHERFFSEALVEKVKQRIETETENGEKSSAEEQLLEAFLEQKKVIAPKGSLEKRLADSISSLQNTNLSTQEVKEASKMMKALMNEIRAVNHLKYHHSGRKSRQPRWMLYPYDLHTFPDSIFVIEAVLPVGKTLSLSFHIATLADSEAGVEENWQQIQAFFKKLFPENFKNDRPINQKVVLINSMGESPGVVTEAVEYWEKKDEIDFEKIVVIAPGANEAIRKNGVENFLREIYGKRLEPHYLPEIADVTRDDEVKKFIEKTMEVIKEYRQRDYTIFLNAAGGRKPMSAAMVRLAQISDIDTCFHVLITDPELEDWMTENGTIEALLKLQREREVWRAPLFPDLDKVQIVHFPSKQF